MSHKRQIRWNIGQLLEGDSPFSWFSKCFFNIQLVFVWIHFPKGDFSVFDLQKVFEFSDSLPNYSQILSDSKSTNIPEQVLFAMTVTFFLNAFLADNLGKSPGRVSIPKNSQEVPNYSLSQSNLEFLYYLCISLFILFFYLKNNKYFNIICGSSMMNILFEP